MTSKPTKGNAALAHDIESGDESVPWSDLERLAWADGRRRRSSALSAGALPKVEGDTCYHLFRDGKSEHTNGHTEVEMVWGRDTFVDDMEFEIEEKLQIWRQQALRRWAMIRRVVRDGTYRQWLPSGKKSQVPPGGQSDEKTFWCCIKSLENVGFLDICCDRCRAIWQERSLLHTVEKTAILFLSYIAVGLAVYCSSEGWAVVDSLYFITCTFTTVGFGELSPTRSATKVFTIFYSFAGIYMIGEIVGRGISRLAHTTHEKLEEIKRMNDKGVMDAFDNGELEETPEGKQTYHWHGNDADKYDTGHSDLVPPSGTSRPRLKWQRSMTNLGHVPDSQFESRKQIFAHITSFFFSLWERTGPLFFWVIIQLIGVIFFMLKEGWSVLDSIYWVVIASTTIGYGDQVPSTGGRVFCIFFIPLFVGLTADLLAKLAQSTLDQDVKRAKEDMLRSRLLLEEDLMAMDADGDGVVTRLEYIEFMLLSMGRVDKPILERLHKMFDRLDADGSGTLEPDDLMLISNRKGVLERTARKMKMEEYKNMLIEKGSMNKERKTDRFKVMVMSRTLQNLKRNSLLARIADIDE